MVMVLDCGSFSWKKIHSRIPHSRAVTAHAAGADGKEVPTREMVLRVCGYVTWEVAASYKIRNDSDHRAEPSCQRPPRRAGCRSGRTRTFISDLASWRSAARNGHSRARSKDRLL